MRANRVVPALLAGLALVLIVGCQAATKHESGNAVLFEAMSPFEDLTEYALAEDATNAGKAIQSANDSVAAASSVLSEKASGVLNAKLKEIAAAEKDGDFPGMAMLAVDSYKVLVDQLDVSTLTVPKEVAVLDFVGFKLHALLKQKEVDWKLVNETALDGQRQWNDIRGSVSDTAIRDAMDTVIEGLQSASKSKNVEKLEFAAQVDLDLVDLLEGYFEKGK